MARYNEYLISTLDTDGQILKYQGINSHSTEYTPMCFMLLMG